MLSLIITLLLTIFTAGQAVQAIPLPADTVRTTWRNGLPYRAHTVKPKETLYSLSRHYNVPVPEIKAANPGVESLQIGQLVYIPGKGTAAPKPLKPGGIPAASRTFSVDDQGKKWHTVTPGQTLYSLSNLFEISVEELQRLNNLSGNDLRAGQVLLVGKQTGQTSPNVGQYVPEKDDELVVSTKPLTIVKPAVTSETAEPVKKPEPEEPALSAGEATKRINENGLAAVINEQFKSNKLLALHRSAPIGTLLQVKNSMNGRTVFVRVIGTLPDTGENDKVIVKISKKAYQQLGALDARFLAEVSYAQ